MRAATDRAPTIDSEVFEGLREQFGTDTLMSLAGGFCEQAPLVNEVVVASRGENGYRLARFAHQLHSAASVLGVTRLAELCGEAERLGRHGKMEESEAVAAQIATAYVRAVSVMSEILRRPGPMH
jgi:HPt (histidine-containing phosphotransfer) domain-containing protein